MPMYDYKCLDCGKESLVVLTLKEHESNKVKCPNAAAPRCSNCIRRLWPTRPRKASSMLKMTPSVVLGLPSAPATYPSRVRFGPHPAALLGCHFEHAGGSNLVVDGKGHFNAGHTPWVSAAFRRRDAIFSRSMTATLSLGLIGLLFAPFLHAQEYPADSKRQKRVSAPLPGLPRCGGRGDGPDAKALKVAPANFHRFSSFLKSDQELLRTIELGVVFSPMHAWRGQLTDGKGKTP